MDERGRRLWDRAEADVIGWGGVAAVARATGMAISTCARVATRCARARFPGTSSRFGSPTLEALVDPITRGDPESPLRWTCKSTHLLAAEMFTRHGIRVSNHTVARLLRDDGYSLQAPNQSVEGWAQ